jgi:hypothetical protein
MELQPLIIFQQDGVPLYWSLAVEGFVNQTFQGSWIGWIGPIPWPTSLPDTTLLNFFLGGCMEV